MRILLTLIFVAIGLSMIALPIYYGYSEPVNAVYIPKPIPTMSEPVIEPTATIEPTPETTVLPTTTPVPTPAGTPTPVPPPDFLKPATTTYELPLNYRMTTGEYVVLIENPDARPLQNKEQVRQFMQWDDTSSIKYGTYFTCGHAAKRIHDNAELNSVECHLVALKFSETYWHSIVVFPTIDDGDVFVESVGYDKWAYAVEGEKYTCSPMQHTNSYNLGGFNINYPVIQWMAIY